jgi:hypothetical protein
MPFSKYLFSLPAAIGYSDSAQLNQTTFTLIFYVITQRYLEGYCGSSAGTLIEWYDFYIFGSLSTILSQKFFPDVNPTAALLSHVGNVCRRLLCGLSAHWCLAALAT